MSDNCKPSAVLYKAANVIEERGKATGTYEDNLGRVCLVGAINAATTGDARFGDACANVIQIEVRDYLIREGVKPTFNWNGSAIEVYWNDKVAKSKTAVAKKLREVARYLKSQGK